MKAKHKTAITFVLLMLALLALTSLCACNEKAADNTESFSCYTVYNSATRKTTIVWTAEIVNDSIYNMTECLFSLKLDNTNNTVVVACNELIKCGKSFRFMSVTEVDGNYTSATCFFVEKQYESFLQTYKLWLIVAAGIAVVAGAAYIIVMKSEMIFLDDLGDFLADYWWIIPIVYSVLLLPALFIFSWVHMLVVLGGLLLAVLIIVIAQAIYENS